MTQRADPSSDFETKYYDTGISPSLDFGTRYYDLGVDLSSSYMQGNKHDCEEHNKYLYY